MEKDYFKDRPDTIKARENLQEGTTVFICTKKMQPYAKELKDLNMVTITKNLTSSAYHPRGQKIQGIETLVDAFGNPLIDSEGEIISTELVGRCTYIVSTNGITVKTLDGDKYIEGIYLNGKMTFRFLNKSEIEKRYCLYCNMSLFNKVLFEVPIARYSFFKTKEELINTAKKISIQKPVLHAGFITAQVNNNNVRLENATTEGVPIINESVIEYISNNFASKNNTRFAFNKQYDLQIKNFSIKQIKTE